MWWWQVAWESVGESDESVQGCLSAVAGRTIAHLTTTTHQEKPFFSNGPILAIVERHTRLLFSLTTITQLTNTTALLSHISYQLILDPWSKQIIVYYNRNYSNHLILNGNHATYVAWSLPFEYRILKSLVFTDKFGIQVFSIWIVFFSY